MPGQIAINEAAPFLIDTATQNAPANAQTVTLTNGQIAVVWQELTGDGGDNSGWAVKAKILAADGSVAVGEFLVNTTVVGDQIQPAVTALAGGGFAVAWTDGSAGVGTARGLDVKAQIFTTSGVKSGGELQINTTTNGDQSMPQISGLTTGGFVVGWSDGHFAVFGATGAAVTGDVAVPTYTTTFDPLTTTFLDVEAGAGGQFVVLANEYRLIGSTFSNTRYDTVYDASGALVRQDGLYGDSSRTSRLGSAEDFTYAAALGTVFGYQYRGLNPLFQETSNTLYVRAVDATGTITTLGALTLPAGETLTDLAIAAVHGTDVIAAYSDSSGLHVGTFSGGTFAEVLYDTGSPPAVASQLDVAVMADGRFLVTWVDAAGSVQGQLFGYPSDAAAQDGTAGMDVLTGTSGRDLIRGLGGNDIIIGGGGADYLYGGDGDDVIVAGTGAAKLYGGTGHDTYYVSDGATQVIEQLGEGQDAVHASFDYTLGANVEALFLTGGASTGVGNALDNIIGGNALANVLSGLDGNDGLFGGAGGDTLYGGTGRDSLYGQAGIDILYGETGDDRIEGGIEGDTLFGQEGADSLFGEDGFDTLYGGVGDDFLAGQADNDFLWGEAGNDFLFGESGADQLAGGTGADVFYYRTQTEGGDSVGDSIVDFNSAEGDRFVFQGSNFGAPAGFQLTAGLGFISGPGAAPTAATATVYYDTSTGDLWYDIDGTGAATGQLIARILNNTTLHASDFIFA